MGVGGSLPSLHTCPLPDGDDDDDDDKHDDIEDDDVVDDDEERAIHQVLGGGCLVCTPASCLGCCSFETLSIERNHPLLPLIWKLAGQ